MTEIARKKMIKTRIFYFSGTGNSLYAAKTLNKEIEDSELISIVKILDIKLVTTSERIIIVFPVYLWGLPKIIREFLEMFPPLLHSEIYAIATYGGIAGDPFKYVEAILARKNLSLSSGFLIRMPENFIFRYPPLPKMIESICLKQADGTLDCVIHRIKEKKKKIVQKSRFGINWLLSIQGEFYYDQIYIKKKLNPRDYFWVDTKCSNCGICKKVCPKQNITLISGNPVWGDNCELCVACINWCPQAAIQMKKATLKRNRYHNPTIKVSELF